MNKEISRFVEGDLLFKNFKGKLVEDESPYDLSGMSIQFPVFYDMNAYKIDDGLELDITVSYTIETNCSRCLIPVQENVQDKTHIKVIQDEIEEDSLEEDFIFVENLDEFPLEELIFSQVITSAPTKSLCKDDCKGLCPTCGQDLNIKECDCADKGPSNQFEVLKDLFAEDKEV